MIWFAVTLIAYLLACRFAPVPKSRALQFVMHVGCFVLGMVEIRRSKSGRVEYRVNESTGAIAETPYAGMPHELYPELLNWKAGDRVFTYAEFDCTGNDEVYRGVTPDGFVLYESFGKLRVAPLAKFMKGARNQRTDRDGLEARLASASEYMGILANVQRELEAAGLTMPRENRR